MGQGVRIMTSQAIRSIISNVIIFVIIDKEIVVSSVSSISKTVHSDVAQIIA
jgi:hypothetical protein